MAEKYTLKLDWSAERLRVVVGALAGYHGEAHSASEELKEYSEEGPQTLKLSWAPERIRHVGVVLVKTAHLLETERIMTEATRADNRRRELSEILEQLGEIYAALRDIYSYRYHTIRAMEL